MTHTGGYLSARFGEKEEDRLHEFGRLAAWPPGRLAVTVTSGLLTAPSTCAPHGARQRVDLWLSEQTGLVPCRSSENIGNRVGESASRRVMEEDSRPLQLGVPAALHDVQIHRHGSALEESAVVIRITREI